MAHPEQYFILIYDIPRRDVQIEEFGGDVDAASEAYSGLEERYRGSDDIEVVMVGADSLDTIKKTHSHYFARTAEELFQQFLTGMAAD